MRRTVLVLSLVCIATCQLLAQHGRVPDWDAHTVLHLPEEPSPTDYARIAILQLMHDKVVDPRLDVVRRLIRSSNFDWQTKHALQNEIQFQHSKKDRLRNYAPQPEDSILFAKVEANSQIFVRKLMVNPVIDLPYEFYEVAIPYCDGNFGALPGGYDPVPDSWQAGNQYYPRWKFLPKSKTLVIDRKFTIGVHKTEPQNPVADSLPAMLFLGREFLSYESNVLLLRRLMRECAPGHIGDSILIEEMVYLDAAGDYAPTDAVIHSKVPGGWNLHFQSYGLCYNADVYTDHIDYSLLMVPENFVPEVQHSYEYTHNLERGWHRWNHYEIKFLRRVGDAFYYRIQVGNDTFLRAKYWHGNVTFSGERRE